MSETRQAWQSAMHEAPTVSLSRPCNENDDLAEGLPWEAAKPSEPMPLMFALTWFSGRAVFYAYSDLRIVECVSPCEIILILYPMEKIRVSITGRNLGDLGKLLSRGRILEIRKTASTDWFSLEESQPAIEDISVDTLTGPSE